MKNIIATINVAFVLLPMTFSSAVGAASVSAKEVAGGRLSWFKSVAINPTGAPRTLSEARSPSENEKDIITGAQRLLEKDGLLGLLLLENGRIVFEGYREPAQASTPLLGYSMSKSVTSLVVGQAVCDGLLRLENQAQSYIPEFEGMVYGTATLLQLLTMSSGAPRAGPSGWQRSQSGQDILRGRITMFDGIREFGGPQTGTFSPMKPGDEFAYKNNDTNALSVILNSVLKESFSKYFESTIWRAVGAESKAYWNVDKDGLFGGWAGFHATLRDWGRIGLYVSDKYRSNEDDCFSKYVKSATTPRVKNVLKLGGVSFASYGYQFWTENRHTSPKSFWMIGYAGQRMGINPDRGRIMVVVSHKTDPQEESYRLFSAWEKQ